MTSPQDPRYKPETPGDYKKGERQLSQRTALPDPELKPDVPPFAEKMNILEHVRTAYHPMFLNAAGGPDINGPRRYLGLELRCPICKQIQYLGEPGVEHQCPKCNLFYKYTAVKGNTWLWVWKAQPKLVVESEPLTPCSMCVTPLACVGEKECALGNDK